MIIGIVEIEEGLELVGHSVVFKSVDRVVRRR